MVVAPTQLDVEDAKGKLPWFHLWYRSIIVVISTIILIILIITKSS